jgi:hypothetical protein
MGSAPKSPDPSKLAAAQRDENTWTSQYNTIGSNANQYGPYGSVTNTPGAKIPIYDQHGNVTGYGTQWNQTTSMSPEQKAIYDQQTKAQLGMGTLANQQLGMATSVLGKPFNTAGLPDWQTYGAGPDLRYEKGRTDRAAIEDAILQSYTRGTAPIQRAEDAQLAARGQGAGSPMAYKTQLAREDAAGEATRQAYLASGQESRTADEAANKALQQGWLNENTRADQGNWLRTAEFGERQQERNQIVNEIAAMMGGSQATVMQGQGFQGSQVNPFDIAGSMMQKYGIDAQNYQNKMTGLFNLGGSLTKLVNPISLFGGG